MHARNGQSKRGKIRDKVGTAKFPLRNSYYRNIGKQTKPQIGPSAEASPQVSKNIIGK